MKKQAYEANETTTIISEERSKKKEEKLNELDENQATMIKMEAKASPTKTATTEATGLTGTGQCHAQDAYDRPDDREPKGELQEIAATLRGISDTAKVTLAPEELGYRHSGTKDTEPVLKRTWGYIKLLGLRILSTVKGWITARTSAMAGTTSAARTVTREQEGSPWNREERPGSESEQVRSHGSTGNREDSHAGTNYGPNRADSSRSDTNT